MDEILRDTDVGLIPNDRRAAPANTLALRDFYSRLCIGPNGNKGIVGELRPGATYWIDGDCPFPNVQGHRMPVVRGAGGKLAHDAPTVIRYERDPGPGASPFRPTGNALFTLHGISFVGAMSRAPSGQIGWQANGPSQPCRSYVHDVSVVGFNEGLGISGDHTRTYDFVSQGNARNIAFTESDTQGDIKLWDGQAGGAFISAVGVARGGAMAGVWIQNVELGTSPLVIDRYEDGSGKVVPNWINDCVMIQFASEFSGGLLRNDLDASGISGLVMDFGSNWGMSFKPWEGLDMPAAMYTLGLIDVRFLKSLPASKVGKPMVIAKGGKVRGFSGVGMQQGLDRGQRVIQLLAKGGASSLQGSYIGGRHGPTENLSVFSTVAPQTVPVRKGDALCFQNEYDVKRYEKPQALKRTNALGEPVIDYIPNLAVGIAGHDANPGEVVQFFTNGISGLQARNTSGKTIEAHDLLVPHEAGGFAAASYTDRAAGEPPHHPVARALNKILDGELGNVHVFFDSFEPPEEPTIGYDLLDTAMRAELERQRVLAA